MKKQEYDAFLKILTQQLADMNKQATKLSSKQAKIIAAITLLNQLIHAEEYNISQQWIDCADEFLKKFDGYSILSAARRTFLGNQAVEDESAVDKIFKNIKDDFEPNSPTSSTSDEEDDWTLIQAQNSDSELQRKAYKIMLGLRVDINLALEDLAIQSNIAAEQIQSIINVSNNPFDLLAYITPAQAPRAILGALLKNGAKMRYGAEENRDDVSTKALDQYKRTLAECINPALVKNSGTKGILVDLLNDISEGRFTPAGEVEKLVAHAQEIITLESKSGMYLMLCDNLNLIKDNIKNKEHFDVLVEQFESIMHDQKDLLPKDIQQLLIKAKQELIQIAAQIHDEQKRNSATSFKA